MKSLLFRTRKKLKNPIINVSGGDFTFSAEQSYSLSFYQGDNDFNGYYPIINSKKALDLLEKGNYITTVPEEFSTSAEYVKKVELIYRTGVNEKIFMPYYRFYVELPEYKQEDTGLNANFISIKLSLTTDWFLKKHYNRKRYFS